MGRKAMPQALPAKPKAAVLTIDTAVESDKAIPSNNTGLGRMETSAAPPIRWSRVPVRSRPGVDLCTGCGPPREADFNSALDNRLAPAIEDNSESNQNMKTNTRSATYLRWRSDAT